MPATIRNDIPDNHVGYVAVFLALSGTAIALPGTKPSTPATSSTTR